MPAVISVYYPTLARYYDPPTGRFMSRDPLRGSLTDPQTQNAYAYALNNPVNRVDPRGLASETADGGFSCQPGLLVVAALLFGIAVLAGGFYLWAVGSALAFGLTIEALHAAVQLGWIAGASGAIAFGGLVTIDKACGGSGDAR